MGQKACVADVFCFAAGSRSNLPQLAALSVSSLSPVAVPVLLHPPDGSDSDEDVCAFSSLFTVTESGSFSAWPMIVATFHRARVALMDALCRSSPAFLRTVVHSEMRFRGGFRGTETRPDSQVFTMGPDRVVSPVTKPESHGSPARQKALFGDLSNLPSQLFAGLEARATELERTAPNSYSLISSRLSPAASACGVVALGLLAEAGNSHPSAVAGLYRVIRRFSLPVLLLPRLLVLRGEDVVFSEVVTTIQDAPPRSGPRVPGNSDSGFSIGANVYQDPSDSGICEVLTDFTEQSMSIIVDRGETSLPLDAIREVCCAVTDPLMLEAEALYSRLSRPGISSGSEEKDNTPDSDLGASRGLFVYDFVKSLLRLGRSHLALSRSVVSESLLGQRRCFRVPRRCEAGYALWQFLEQPARSDGESISATCTPHFCQLGKDSPGTCLSAVERPLLVSPGLSKIVLMPLYVNDVSSYHSWRRIRDACRSSHGPRVFED